MHFSVYKDTFAFYKDTKGVHKDAHALCLEHMISFAYEHNIFVMLKKHVVRIKMTVWKNSDSPYIQFFNYLWCDHEKHGRN